MSGIVRTEDFEDGWSVNVVAPSSLAEPHMGYEFMLVDGEGRTTEFSDKGYETADEAFAAGLRALMVVLKITRA